MKTVSTRKTQFNEEYIKDFVLSTRGNYLAFLQHLAADKGSSLDEEEIVFWRSYFINQVVAAVEAEFKMDFPDRPFDTVALANALHRILTPA